MCQSLPLWKQHRLVTEGQCKSLVDCGVHVHEQMLHPPAESEVPAARPWEPWLWSEGTRAERQFSRSWVGYDCRQLSNNIRDTETESHLLLLFVMSCFSGHLLSLQGCSWQLSLQTGDPVRQNCFLCLLQRKGLEGENNLIKRWKNKTRTDGPE